MINSVKFDIRNNFLVFDDGGMTHSNPNGFGYELCYEIYERILKLAKENEIQIQIACNAIFFDVDNIAKLNMINPHCDKILNLLHKNIDHITVWNHGLNHQYLNESTEFYSYINGKIDYKYQEEHIKISQEIFDKIGFNTNVLVPPGHAWEQDVTDKIAKKYGIKSIAIREFEKKSLTEWIKSPLNPYKKTWQESKYLNSLFRLGLGIKYDSLYFDSKIYHRVNDYILSQFPKSLLIHRRLKLKYPIDHFFAHIQNLQNPNNFQLFDQIIKKIKSLKINEIE